MGRKKTIHAVLLLIVLIITGIPVGVSAVTYHTVTFYTDASLNTVYEIQQVARRKHPTVPLNVPDDYTENGYRYTFKAWYWYWDNNPSEFSFTDESCEIWGDCKVFAGYTPYLQEGYEMILTYLGETIFETDTSIPVDQILKKYPGCTVNTVRPIPEYEQGGGSIHKHVFEYTDPVWNWKIVAGATIAEATYYCECGDSEAETVTPVFSDHQGTRTYTATDTHGNTDTHTVTLTYTVNFDGLVVSQTYNWGDVCTLTADTFRTWYIGRKSEENKVADGTLTHSFAVTDNTTIITGDTDLTEQQAAVRTELVSNSSGTARFNAKWSIPKGAIINSVIIYRGYTTSDMDIAAEKIKTYGSTFNTHFLCRNGDYTLNLHDLSADTYQHVIIVINYTPAGGEATELISMARKVRITDKE